MLFEEKTQKSFDEGLGLSIVKLGLNNWTSNSLDKWGYLNIEKGQMPINSYPAALAMSAQLQSRRFESLYKENIAWLTENGYKTYECSRIANTLNWVFGKRDHMIFRKKECYNKNNRADCHLEILLYTDRHKNPEVWGAMYLPMKRGVIKVPNNIKYSDERDLCIQEYLQNQTRELCRQLGENFNIYTYLKLTDEGLGYESYVRFCLPVSPVTRLTAKEADQILHETAQSSKKAFSAYLHE